MKKHRASPHFSLCPIVSRKYCDFNHADSDASGGVDCPCSCKTKNSLIFMVTALGSKFQPQPAPHLLPPSQCSIVARHSGNSCRPWVSFCASVFVLNDKARNPPDCASMPSVKLKMQFAWFGLMGAEIYVHGTTFTTNMPVSTLAFALLQRCSLGAF